MKPGGSLQKGKQFERSAAKILEKILGVKAVRVPCSGGMATAQDIKDPRYKGDITLEDPAYAKVVIECKISGEQLTVADMFNPKSLIGQWMKQAKEESGEECLPLLIFKYKYSPVYAGIYHTGADIETVIQRKFYEQFKADSNTIVTNGWFFFKIEG